MAARPIREVKELLGLLESGKLAPALNAELRKALLHLMELSADGRKVAGTVTLDLKLSVSGKEVEFFPTIKSKLPNPPRGRSFFWLTDNGEISTEHPTQVAMDFPVRDVREAAE